MCTQAPKSASSTLSLARQGVAWAQQNTTVVAVLVGATVVMYGFYRGSMRMMHFFFNVSDKQIFTGGFVVGILAAIAIGASGVFAMRFLTFHVDDVYRVALRELRKSAAVEEALGGVWRPANFRGYSIESLKDAVQGSERRARSTFFEAPSRRIQMIFMLQGMKCNAMVSLEAFKRAGVYEFEMLAVDVVGSEQHIFLKGTKDHALFPEVAQILSAASRNAK